MFVYIFCPKYIVNFILISLCHITNNQQETMYVVFITWSVGCIFDCNLRVTEISGNLSHMMFSKIIINMDKPIQ
jgi:hypothetical protein